MELEKVFVIILGTKMDTGGDPIEDLFWVMIGKKNFNFKNDFRQFIYVIITHIMPITTINHILYIMSLKKNMIIIFWYGTRIILLNHVFTIYIYGGTSGNILIWGL